MTVKDYPENQPENSDSISSDKEGSKTQLKSNNPFLQSDSSSLSPSSSSENVKPAFNYTLIPSEKLIEYPFKSLNRIIDDLKYTTVYKKKWPNLLSFSLLNSIPITYSSDLSQLLSSSNTYRDFELLTLNNHLDYAPSFEEIELKESDQILKNIRGLLVNRSLNEINHVKFTILERKPSQYIYQNIDKHEYHLIPKSLISNDDLKSLNDESITSFNLIDDAFFKSMNSNNNHILRVSIYNAEFEIDDLKSIIDQESIKNRYLKGIERNPDSNLSKDLIPSPIHCFQTLIKVLKGPINLPPNRQIQTISLKNTNLDAKIDIDLLFNKLSFTTNDDELVPPSLTTNPSLRESYIRKIMEIIYIAKKLKLQNQLNDFDTTYSFSDNCSLIFRTFGEVDKHISMTYINKNNSNQLPFFTNLSCCSYFQDEIIIRCFENTIRSDPVNSPHYVDSLKNIIQFNSNQHPSKLRAYYNNLSSRGELVGYSDYMDALKSIGIQLTGPNVEVDDDFIVAMYFTAYKNDSKNYFYYNKNLRMIANIRKSQFLFKFLDNEIIPIGLALDELGVELITEDEVVITAFEFRLDELLQASNFKISGEVSFLYKCLLSVAVKRKSYILMHYIETKYPNIIGPNYSINFKDACEKLNCEISTSDFEVISKFQEKLAVSQVSDTYSSGDEHKDDIRSLRQALKSVAQAKDSKILFSFLNSGKIDSSLLPAENWPSGLDNIGNTCYLNSLLQYYFCIKPLRDLILNFNELDVDFSKYKNRKIGGREVEESEIKRSIQFIYHLKQLFNEMIHTNKRCVQPSKELAYLSFLPLSQPVAFKTNKEIQAEIESAELEARSSQSSDVVEVLEDTPQEGEANSKDQPILISSQSPDPGDGDVSMAEDPKPKPASSDEMLIDLGDDELKTEGPVEDENHPEAGKEEIVEDKETEPQILKISTDQMESTIEVGRQQDVTECIENVTFQIETALEPLFIEEDGEQFDLIKKLFYGKTKQTIKPMENENGSNKLRESAERFFSLIINVSDHPKDIYDSLDNYFNEDVVSLEEGLVKKTLTIKELPEVLQFHVQRVLFDREKLIAYKSLEPIPFSEQIYLDRYLDTEDEEILNKKQEVFKWKSEISSLYEKRDDILKLDPETNLSIIDSLIATKKFLEAKIINHESLSIKAETILAIQDQIDSLKDELQSIHDRLTILQEQTSNQFKAYTKIGYSIFAIFIHRGEASYGHYWVYIKDPHRNIYRKYNDEIVTEVPASEVLNFTEGNTATPYYIVYVKDSLKKDYVEPLKRVINKC